MDRAFVSHPSPRFINRVLISPSFFMPDSENNDPEIGPINYGNDDDDFPAYDADNEAPISTVINLPPLDDSGQKKKMRRRSRLILWMKFFTYMFVFFMVLGMIGMGFAYFYGKPRYDLAQTFDLSELKELEVASRILDRNGKELGRIFVQNRRPIAINEVSPNFINALISAEDSSFYKHNGVDYKGVLRAVYQNWKTKEMNQGASTITQQLGRNTFDLKERKISRKVVEAFLAYRIEEEVGSKDKILELYVNRIYFGDGYYGIGAAAEGFFGKEAKDLSLSEAATLAGVIRAPYYRSPRKFPIPAKKTRDQVLHRMFLDKSIDEAQMLRAQRVTVKTVEKGNLTGKSAFVYEKVRQEVMELLGKDTVSKGGFQIQTTIVGDIQKLAEEALKDQMSMIEEHPDFTHPTLAQYKKLKAQFKKTANQDARAPDPKYLQCALLMIDNKTGAVIAQVGSRDFNDSMYDRTSMGRRPTGTAFLPFVYAAAFEKGLFPGTLTEDSPMDTRKIMVGGMTGILGEWGPENHENVYENMITARRSLAKSKNAASVRIGMKTGVENVVALSERAGMSFEGDLKKFNATFLGRNGSSMRDFCLAYTIFPNKGKRPEKTHIISGIRDRAGNVIYSPAVSMKKDDAIDRYTAYQINSVLSDTFRYGTGLKARDKYGLGNYPVAGKTGTEYNFTDNWFVGYTTEVTCAVWTGFDQSKTIYPGAFSSETVLPVWTKVMNAASEAFEPKAFIPPPDSEQVEICYHSGELASDDCYETKQQKSGISAQVRTTYVEYLRPGTNVNTICHIHGKSGNRSRNLSNNPISGPLRARVVVMANSDPVYPIAPTLISNKDPYNSLTPIVRARVAVPVDETEEEPSGEESTVDSNGLPVARPVLIREIRDLPAQQRVGLPPPRAIKFD